MRIQTRPPLPPRPRPPLRQPSAVQIAQAGVEAARPAEAVGIVVGGIAGAILARSSAGALLGAAAGLLGVAGVAAGLALRIDRKGFQDDGGKADCALVLGCAANPDGTPGPSLKARLEHAEDLYREGRVEHILLSGGPGKSGQVESEVGRRQALADGIPEEALTLERESRNTWENFRFSQPIMEQHGWKSALVCTDPYHENRSLAIGRELGLDVHPSPALTGPAAQDPDRRVAFVEREMKSSAIYWGHRALRALHLEAPSNTP